MRNSYVLYTLVDKCCGVFFFYEPLTDVFSRSWNYDFIRTSWPVLFCPIISTFSWLLYTSYDNSTTKVEGSSDLYTGYQRYFKLRRQTR